MASVVPDSGKIKTFRTEAAFESWMRKNHARANELWLRIYKKDSGVPSITITEAFGTSTPTSITVVETRI